MICKWAKIGKCRISMIGHEKQIISAKRSEKIGNMFSNTGLLPYRRIWKIGYPNVKWPCGVTLLSDQPQNETCRNRWFLLRAAQDRLEWFVCANQAPWGPKPMYKPSTLLPKPMTPSMRAWCQWPRASRKLLGCQSMLGLFDFRICRISMLVAFWQPLLD